MGVCCCTFEHTCSFVLADTSDMVFSFILTGATQFTTAQSSRPRPVMEFANWYRPILKSHKPFYRPLAQNAQFGRSNRLWTVRFSA